MIRSEGVSDFVSGFLAGSCDCASERVNTPSLGVLFVTFFLTTFTKPRVSPEGYFVLVPLLSSGNK